MADVITKDLVIVGGGPAGLSAAIYAKRALLDTVVLEKQAVGGQVITTTEVENYPGMPNTDGFTITDTLQKQATDLGAEIVMANVLSIVKDPETNLFVLEPLREPITQRLSLFLVALILVTLVLPTKKSSLARVFLTALPATECSIVANRCLSSVVATLL